MGSLDDLIQSGARQIIQQTIEAELATLLEKHDNMKIPGDECAALRNRSCSGSTFNSTILSLYIHVMIGFTPAGKQRVAIANGLRKYNDFQAEMLLDLT